MAISGQPAVGSRLFAVYKGLVFRAEVVRTGDVIRYRVEDHVKDGDGLAPQSGANVEFTALSAAAGAICGTNVNGKKFWTVELPHLEPLDADMAQLRSKVPADGTPVGNFWLRGQVGWDDQRYFSVRDRLVKGGVLALGKGKGGIVFQAHPTSDEPSPQSSPQVAKKPFQKGKEPDLYPAVEKALSEIWRNALNHSNFLVETTAHQGSKPTGGMWTRPDVTVVIFDTYLYVPGKFLDLITYEVKPAHSWDVAGVFEAVSHSRAATKTYLLIHTPEGTEIPELDLERLHTECVRFGVGLAIFRDPWSHNSYKFLVEPERRQPDPEEMNQFITQQLSEPVRNRILQWLK
ncbi:MAG: hypothetical protein AAB289_06565 [Chloroflexota bacterium]